LPESLISPRSSSFFLLDDVSRDSSIILGKALEHDLKGHGPKTPTGSLCIPDLANWLLVASMPLRILYLSLNSAVPWYARRLAILTWE
jgi:hypothetical protein